MDKSNDYLKEVKELCDSFLEEEKKVNGGNDTLMTDRTWRIMWASLNNEGDKDLASNLEQLQTQMNVSHPTMVGLVQRLESNRFVTTETDSQDRRNKIVIITEEATNFKNEMIRSREKLHKAMFSSFSENEKDTLKELLNRILDNISGRKEE